MPITSTFILGWEKNSENPFIYKAISRGPIYNDHHCFFFSRSLRWLQQQLTVIFWCQVGWPLHWQFGAKGEKNRGSPVSPFFMGWTKTSFTIFYMLIIKGSIIFLNGGLTSRVFCYSYWYGFMNWNGSLTIWVTISRCWFNVSIVYRDQGSPPQSDWKIQRLPLEMNPSSCETGQTILGKMCGKCEGTVS